MAALAVQTAASMVRTVYLYASESTRAAGGKTTAAMPYATARELSKVGLVEGTKIVYLGDSWAATWARLAKVRIVAEVVPADLPEFWAVFPSKRDEILSALKSTSARVVIADAPPRWAELQGWQRLGSTQFYVYFL
jgi:hypothetical protein